MSDDLIFRPSGDPRMKHPAFGDQFDRACAKSAMTTAAIARKSGVDTSTILAYRRGHASPDDVIRKKLEDLFNRVFP